MGILRLSVALTRAHFLRIVIFVCLSALLCVTAGLLGSFLLGGEGVVQPITVAIVDEDDSIESRLLVGYLEDMELESGLLRFEYTDRAHSQSLLDAGAVSAAIVIPQGFMAGVMDGSNPPFIVTLDAGSPLRAAVIRLFALVFADMLRTGQQGVYIALDAARVHGTAEQWQEMFRTANLRYLAAMLNRNTLLDERELSPTGEVSAAVHYGAAAFVFILLLGATLFLDVWARAASKPVLLRLSALGVGRLRGGLCYLAGGCVPFGATLLLLALFGGAAGALLGLGVLFSAPLVLALVLLTACGGAFLVAASRLLGQGAGANVLVFLYGLVCLFLSGGILPPAYMAPALTALGRLTPHYWLSRLLAGGLSGQLDIAALAGSSAFVMLFAGVALCALYQGAKEGDTL